jgi:hypothetical protein
MGKLGEMGKQGRLVGIGRMGRPQPKKTEKGYVYPQKGINRHQKKRKEDMYIHKRVNPADRPTGGQKKSKK